MRNVRYLLRERALLLLLALALVLRSIIAPGFMLDTSTESPLGITVTFCEGLGGINNIDDTATGVHAAHHGHATHPDHDTPVDDNGHTGKDHSMPSASCAALSGSIAYIKIRYDVTVHLASLTAVAVRPDTASPVTRSSYNQPQQPRAPPISLNIV